jgi:hypothetical protein
MAEMEVEVVDQTKEEDSLETPVEPQAKNYSLFGIDDYPCEHLSKFFRS